MTERVAVPPVLEVMVWSPARLEAPYVKVYVPVPDDPVKVSTGAASPSQTVGVLRASVADGFGLMVTTAVLLGKF